MGDVYDVFLSHNGQDKPAVRALAEALRKRKLRVWLDEDNLRPGMPWQKGLEGGISTSASIAVLIGEDGLGPWENEELQGALRLAVKNQRPVIPVILPDAPQNLPELPMFLNNRTWVDLRPALAAAALDKLEWGITGVKPGQSHEGAEDRLHPGDNNIVIEGASLEQNNTYLSLKRLIAKAALLRRQNIHGIASLGIPNQNLLGHLSVYSLANEKLFEIYDNLTSPGVEESDYLIKNYIVIEKNIDRIFDFIVGQEIRDFHQAFSHRKIKRIFCFDTSFERGEIEWWKNGNSYDDLTQHTWNLLHKHQRKECLIERCFVVFEPEKLMRNRSKLRNIYNLAMEQKYRGLRVYFVLRSRLKKSINEIVIDDSLLDFHIIEDTLVDVMDINSLISYRLEANSSEGKSIVEAFTELFISAKKSSIDNNNGFELTIKHTLDDFCELVQNLSPQSL